RGDRRRTSIKRRRMMTGSATAAGAAAIATAAGGAGVGARIVPGGNAGHAVRKAFEVERVVEGRVSGHRGVVHTGAAGLATELVSIGIASRRRLLLRHVLEAGVASDRALDVALHLHALRPYLVRSSSHAAHKRRAEHELWRDRTREA